MRQNQIKWGYWDDYEKIVVNDKVYAKVGDWLYTRHAIENLYPLGMGMAPGHTSNHPPLNLSPKFVNDILDDKAIKVIEVQKDGISRSGYRNSN